MSLCTIKNNATDNENYPMTTLYKQPYDLHVHKYYTINKQIQGELVWIITITMGKINLNGRELYLTMMRYTSYEGADINIGSYYIISIYIFIHLFS